MQIIWSVWPPASASVDSSHDCDSHDERNTAEAKNHLGMTKEELEKAPHSGNLFALNTDVQGKPDFKFAN